MKRGFASDNNSGVHPRIMEAILGANVEHAVGYGNDEWTQKINQRFAAIFGEDVFPYCVFNGTGANMIALQAATRPFHCIISPTTGHINSDECGAPAKFTSCMVKEVVTSDGKLTPELIRPYLFGFGDQHHSQPKVIYISQSTEMGTIYKPDEIRAICDLAHQHGMYVHMDGSRLANACATLGLGMKALSRDCGVDILSLGGTKNGMMMGETVLAFRPELVENMQFIRKQSAQLYSKMRFISAQYEAYFEQDLWMELASHANRMASILEKEIKEIPEVRITQPVEANALFLILPPEVTRKMKEHYYFYTWDPAVGEERLVCSWDTTLEDINGFVALLKEAMKGR